LRTISILAALIISLNVIGQIPNGYYDSAEGLSGEDLKIALYNIIKGHIEFPYTSSSTDTWDILKEADQDPDNSNNVLGIYSNFSMDAAQEFNSGDGWSREHVWAKSRGDFGTSLGAGTDVHHLRAADISTNSARNNRNFDNADIEYVDNSGTYNGTTQSKTSSSEWSWEPPNEVKGDVARMIFYMATRYEGENDEPDLELTETLMDNTDKSPFHARLSTLLAWHLADAVSNEEINRNNIIFSYQENRNPYIDHPEYVCEIYDCDNTVTSFSFASIKDKISLNVFPNPTDDFINLRLNLKTSQSVQINILDINGQSVYSLSNRLLTNFNEEKIDISELENGLYILKIYTDLGFTQTKKISINK